MHSSRRDGVYGQYTNQPYNTFQPQQQHGQQGDDSYTSGYTYNPNQQQYTTYQAYNQNNGRNPDLGAQGYGGHYGGGMTGGPAPIQTTSYNPAAYADPRQPLSSPTISSPHPHLAMPQGNYEAAHVPYNPAAYPAASPSSQQNTYQAYQSPPPAAYGQYNTPALPPKPPELAQQNSGPYPRAPVDRRGAVSASGVDSYSAYSSHSPQASYTGYNPPAPPAPPTHGYNTNGTYQPYTPPQQSSPAPPPPEHRTLPLTSQEDGFSRIQPLGSQRGGFGRSAAASGASLPSPSQGNSQQENYGVFSSSSTSSRPLPARPNGLGVTHGDSGYNDGRGPDIDSMLADLESPEYNAASMSEAPLVPRSSIARRPVPSRPSPSQATTNGTPLSPRTDSLGNAPPALHTDNEALAPQTHATSGPLLDEDFAYSPGPGDLIGTEQPNTEQPARQASVRTLDSESTAVAPQSGFGDAGGEVSEDPWNDDNFPGMSFHPGFGHQPLAPVSPPATNGRHQSIEFPTNSFGLSADDPEAFSPTRTTARVDTGLTGGLSSPANATTARRMSFEDGDESTLYDPGDGRSSASGSPTKHDYGYPRRTGSGRPLPPTPGSDTYLPNNSGRYGSTSYQQGLATTFDVRKANSLSGPAHVGGPAVVGRSITDAEQRRRHGAKAGYQAETAFPGPSDLDLPAIPAGRRRKFVPSKLSSKEYAECSEPWAISNVLSWIKEMTEGETDLKEQPIVDAIVGLFTHKVPTMNIADAEALSANLVTQMIHEAALVRDEEWVKFSPLRMSGVIYQLTGTGCYSSMVHTTTVQGRCYSRLCMRTLKKIDLQAQQLAPEKKAQGWAEFYGLTEADLKDQDRKKIEIQYMLHEIVTSEDYFIDQLDVLLILYRDGLANHDKQIIALTGKQSKFINEVFGKVPAIKKVNEDYLLSRLKYRQQEQGPWIIGYADIFRDWIRQSRTAYVDYATGLPNAISQVRKQSEQNVLFKQFLDQVREHPRSKRLDWQTYLKAPITRLQRYSLLLATVHKNMKQESREKSNLEEALKEIRAATHECDAKYADQLRRTDISELSDKLKFRPGMENVHLNLTHMGRQIIHRGELTRRGNNNMTWVDTVAILFDHYMVLSKPIRSTGTSKPEIYDVSKLPIPMDLLVLESADDGVVMKHSVKGIVPLPTTAVTRPTGAGTPNPITRTTTGSQQASTPPVGRSQSSPIVATQPAINPTTVTAESEGLYYPFRVQHLGKSESYVLYATSAQIRQEWVEKITFAKQQHAASLHAQNAEPFSMRVLADSAFAYSNAEYIGVMPVHIQGTPLDRALRDLEREHSTPEPRPAAICRSPVNCATAFTPQSSTRNMLAVGTDFGVFITEQDSPRGWYKAINAQNVTQISVLEDFSVLLIIADKALIAFHLDAVCPPSGGPPSNANDQKRTPQKLSGSRDVGFFAVGRMKERMLVFYKKKDGISSTFKVLEPVYQKSSTANSSGSGWSRSRFGLKKGTTEFFRDFDDFYIATDTYAINLFASSLGIATQRGIEVLTLDKKVPFSIPELRTPEVQSIAQRIRDQRPLGMFRLTDSEFLLVFEEVGIYVDKHGEISRAVVMEFVGKARQASLHNGTYLVLVDVSGGFVEVRNAMNGRLRQIIPGKDVKMLDDGMASGATTAGTSLQPGVSRGTIKISMMHPELERSYVVLEMRVNAGIQES